MKRIFIHGLGQTKDCWNKTAACLPHENCLFPDLTEMLRGREVSYNSLFSAFSGYCNDFTEPVDLCGLSLGCVLALNYAVDFPSKVNSLVMIAAQYKMPKNLLRFQNILFRFMPESAFPETGFGKADFINLCSSMTELDFTQSLGKITCPALIICGENDSANKKSSMKMAEMINNAALDIISGAGHEVNVDSPEKLAEALSKFYSR